MASAGLIASRKSKPAARKVVRCVYGRDAWAHCSEYKDELLASVKALTMPGKGILAMDESNGTCGLRLESIGVDNTEPNRQRWRELLLGTKNIGQFCGGAILFTE